MLYFLSWILEISKLKGRANSDSASKTPLIVVIFTVAAYPG